MYACSVYMYLCRHIIFTFKPYANWLEHFAAAVSSFFFVIALVWLLLLLLWLGLCLFMFIFELLLLLQPRPLITTTTKSQFNYNSARPIGQPDSGGHKIRRTCLEQTRTDTLGTLCVISLPVRVSVCLRSVSESTSVCVCLVLMHAYV